MFRAAKIVFLLTAIATLAPAQQIPEQLWGRWIITRELPTQTITCWDEKQAQQLIGTEIQYTAHSFRWKNHVAEDPAVTVSAMTRAQFDREFYGGPNDSRASFLMLGIRRPEVMEIQLGHPPANITGATIEIPGDDVLVKNRSTIIFSVCNDYFEARRERERKKTHP